MARYRVTKDGKEITPGSLVTSTRGGVGRFDHVSRGPEYNGTAKVIVNGREFYARAWDLTVETINDDEPEA